MDGWEDLVPHQFESVSEMRLSAFCTAAQEGDVQKMQKMLNEKLIKDVNQQSPKKRETALHYACRNGQLDAINFLLSNGAAVNIKDTRGKHSLHLASSAGHLECVKLLLEHKASLDFVDKFGRSCLHWASLNKCFEVVELLLEAGAPITYELSNNWEPLHEAVKGGDQRIIKLLITKGAPVNISGQGHKVQPLHIVAREGHTECLKLLLEHGAQVNAVNPAKQTPLHEAAYKGNKECCQQLLLGGADPHAKNNQGRSPLLDACNQGNLQCSILLLDAGSFVNEPDKCEETALHHLLRNNQARLTIEQLAAFTDLLLQYGANPNNAGMNDETPIMVANLMMEKDVLDMIYTSMEKPCSLLHLAKISVRKILRCEYQNISKLELPKKLQIYLLQNSSYFSGW